MKFGTVVLVGRPNTGKSTLLNTLMQQKVAITSPLPQTTRKTIKVLYKDSRGKIVFMDTPGIFNKVEDLVGKKIGQQTPGAIMGANLILCVVDISRPKGEEENKVIGLVRKATGKKILVFNKIDEVVGGMDHTPEYLYLEDEFDATVRISAIKETHIRDLINKIFALLPEIDEKEVEFKLSELGLDGDIQITMGSLDFVAELIREKAYLYLRREVPYSIQVVVEEIAEKDNLLLVKAKLKTNADRYKKMIIGSGGKKIKQIGYTAKKELELMSGRKVYLDLVVETDRHWMEKIDF